MLPETNAYVRSHDRQTKWMCFLIKYNDLLEKYNTTCDKVSPDIKKEFDREIPKVDSNYTCLTVIILDSALKKGENYYPKVFSKECKYIKKIVIRHINENFSDFSFFDYSNDFVEEYIKAMKLMFLNKQF